MTTETNPEHQGLSADEIALLESGDLDDSGAPREDDTDRLRAKVLADELTENQAIAKLEAGDSGADPEDAPAPAPAPSPAPAPEPAPPAPAPAPVADAPAPAADAPAPAPEPAPAPAPAEEEEPAPRPRYNVGDPAKLDAQLAELDKKQAEAFAKLMDGTMSQEDYQTIANEVRRDERDIVAKKALHQANEQNEANDQGDVLRTLIAKAKTPAGGEIDYANDEAAREEFDAALAAINNRASSASKSVATLLNEAHRTVLALRGKTVAAPAPTPSPAPAAAAPAPTPAAPAPAPASRSVDKSQMPPTLSRVPPAADAAISGDEFAHLANLQGIDLEKAFARLTPEQQERYLD